MEDGERWIEFEHEFGDEGDNLTATFSSAMFDDLFADPDPRDSFDFEFARPLMDEADKGLLELSPSIHVKLSGYKMENGQMLKSTGLTLWRAAPLLCEFMTKNASKFVRNRTVLELGAGLGLCGIVASKLGARQVVLTDGDTDTLKEMRKNVEANCFYEVIDLAKTQNVSCRQLRWGHRVEEFRKKFQTFDTILAADVIYVEQMVDPLFDTVAALMENNERGRFLLSFTRRNVSIDQVLEAARVRHLVWTQPEDDAEGVFVMRRRGVDRSRDGLEHDAVSCDGI